MPSIGTPLASNATKALLLGGGELGKEVVIELQRLGIEVAVADRYHNTPAMQVAHRSHVLNMLDGDALEAVVREESPDFVIPEIEAISTSKLVELEANGFRIVPTAYAAHTTMNRMGIRKLAAEELEIPTSPYLFASDFEAFRVAVEGIGLPCVVKPIMSSSGKGQSTVRTEEEMMSAWTSALENARGVGGVVIVEKLIDFSYEITLLTVRHASGTSFCDPIGHCQAGGDYRESWQPHLMRSETLDRCQEIAAQVTNALGGHGLFGVEFFVGNNDEVWFSEVSPRPHDTGLVTLVSQDLSEFALHVRAILGLPIPTIRQFGPAASSVIIVEGQSRSVKFTNVGEALREPDVHIRLFGKPEVRGERRMGVSLALADSLEEARQRARRASSSLVAVT